jgi:hypothetical protein
MGTTGRSAIEPLREALADLAPEVRSAAARSLGQIGPPARVAVPNLLVALSSRVPAVRWAAAVALGRVGSEADEAVPILIEGLVGPDREHHREALAALAGLGSYCQRDAALRLADYAAKILESLGPEAARGIGPFGPNAPLLMAALARVALEDKDRSLRRAARRAAYAIDPVEARKAGIP